MLKVGITGQAGFVGTHLFNSLGLYPTEFTRVEFDDSFFENTGALKEFVKKCDVIIHLAAMNRHGDPQVIYDTNIRLVKQLISAMDATGSRPHVIFSSSTQEERDNPYGRSKKEGRELFETWAARNNSRFTGLIIPNIFGPFGHPFYNSVIATFCYQLTHSEEPKIDIDGNLKLIYVSELLENMIHLIKSQPSTIDNLIVPHSATIKVSDLLKKLIGYKESYFENGIIPCLDNPFDRNLFNTFLCFIDHASFFPYKLKLNTDERGSFVETIKLNSGGQVSFSTTKPGFNRGNHFHTRKAERFAVIRGQARIQLRRIGTEEILTFDLDGNHPSFVDMPVWHTHNITNVGEDDLYTIFWINEFYDPKDPDTYFEEVE